MNFTWDRLVESSSIAGLAFGFVALLARIVVWRLRVRDVANFNAALAAASSEKTRQIIRSNPPPEPSSDMTKIGIALLLLSGAAVGTPLARDAFDAPITETAAEGNAERCERASDCGPGCSCRDNQCRCAASDKKQRKPMPPPQRGPQSSMAALPLRRFAGDTVWAL